MKNKTYDRLKWTAQIALPAIGASYFGLGQIWGFPNGEEIVGTITVIDAFLGTLLGLSAKHYNDDPKQIDGYLSSSSVDPDTGIPNLQLTITKLPDEILSGDMAKLKIGPPPAT